MTIDNRALIAAMRKQPQRPEPNESLFLAFLFFFAALVLLVWAMGWV